MAALAAGIAQRSVRSDLGWAQSSLPTLWFFQPADVHDLVPGDDEAKTVRAVLNFGEEIQDSLTGSVTALAEYFNARHGAGGCVPIRTQISPTMPEAPMVLAGAISDHNDNLADQLIQHNVPLSVDAPGCEADDWSSPCWSPVHEAFKMYDPLYDSKPPGQKALKIGKAAVAQLTGGRKDSKRRADHLNLPGGTQNTPQLPQPFRRQLTVGVFGWQRGATRCCTSCWACSRPCRPRPRPGRSPPTG